MKEWLGLETRPDPDIITFADGTATARNIYLHFLLQQNGLDFEPQAELIEYIEELGTDPADRLRIATETYVWSLGESTERMLTRHFDRVAESLGGVPYLTRLREQAQRPLIDKAIGLCLYSLGDETALRYEVIDRAQAQARTIGWVARQSVKLGVGIGPTAKQIGHPRDNFDTAAEELTQAAHAAGWLGFGYGRLLRNLASSAADLHTHQLAIERKMLF